MSTLLVVGGRLWDGRPLPKSDAVLIEHGRIASVGDAAELAARAPSAQRIDALGATVTPGLCDAHVHLAPWARSLAQLDLHGARTRAETLARVRERIAAEAGATSPLIGRGWDESPWEALPDRASLDAVTGDRPVVLHRHDFHAMWVNSAALRAVRISRDTPDPAGGRIERLPDGEPDGLVRESVVRAFAALEEQAGPALDATLAATAATALHARGITWVHDFQRSAAEMRWSAALARSGGLRVLQHFGLEQFDALVAAGVSSGVGDEWFRVGSLKLFADGTLGSRTASMLAPYADVASVGMSMFEGDHLARIVDRAFRAGVSVTIHAIGDRAVRDSLDAIAAADGVARARLALPPRIEHAQLVDPADLERFAPLGVVASMQPQHAVTDWAVATRGWGDRIEHSYPWRALAERGVRLLFGSDAPVEPPEPWLGLHAALTRQRPDGSPEGGFVPAQRLGLDAALTGYTSAAAFAVGGLGPSADLSVGGTGDLVIWDRDLHRCAPDEVLTARPSVTVMSGRIVYQSTVSAARPDVRARHGAAP